MTQQLIHFFLRIQLIHLTLLLLIHVCERAEIHQKKKNAWHDMTRKIFAPGNEAHGMKITRKIFYTKILIKFEFNGV